MQREVEKHIENSRVVEPPHELLMHFRQPFAANMAETGPPLSPRQIPQDDPRRQSMMDQPPRPNMARPPVPSHLSVSPRRYGSIGGASSTTYARPQIPAAGPPQQPTVHPLSVSTSPGPNLARRHTSADIRQHGWVPSAGSPYPPSNLPSRPWPPSPGSQAPASSDQQVRDVLAQYEMGAPRRLQEQSRHVTPPTAEPSPSMLGVENGWGMGGSRFPQGSSLPATRRSSMASNVHSLLNPADTAERPDEDQQAMADDRKRKRLE